MTTSIASRDVGKLIGRAGVTINELRQKSGCKIEVGERTDNLETDVKLSGSSQEILEKAKTMIDELVTILTEFDDRRLDPNESRGP